MGFPDFEKRERWIWLIMGHGLGFSLALLWAEYLSGDMTFGTIFLTMIVYGAGIGLSRLIQYRP